MSIYDEPTRRWQCSRCGKTYGFVATNDNPACCNGSTMTEVGIDDRRRLLHEQIASGERAVWCYCYGTPEPPLWIHPDDEHADTCGAEHATGIRPDPKKNRWSTGNVSFQVDRPCPRCGEQMLMGHYFLTPDDGQHQHTYYVCLSWPRGRVRCGWHDWAVPSL